MFCERCKLQLTSHLAHTQSQKLANAQAVVGNAALPANAAAPLPRHPSQWGLEDEQMAAEVLALQRLQLQQLEETLAKKQSLRQQLSRMRREAMEEDIQRESQNNTLMLQHVVERLEEQKRVR